ncbi:hypothetical protein TCAL_15231 [Tigriopus californicus]|uniref:Uncharacterized protein n=1 Tax=Tigriopus californicus TaxID=6832 RepID=A0A553NBV5_TIGCA|nr:hypothetical protein TCAL_15231 [Tigriopus californicus]
MDEEKAPEEKVDGTSSNGDAVAANDDDQAALSPKKTMKFTHRMVTLFGKSEKDSKTEDKKETKDEECKEEVKEADDQVDNLHRLVIHALQTAIQVLHIWLRVSLLLAIALKLSIWTNFELFKDTYPITLISSTSP